MAGGTQREKAETPQKELAGRRRRDRSENKVRQEVGIGKAWERREGEEKSV